MSEDHKENVKVTTVAAKSAGYIRCLECRECTFLSNSSSNIVDDLELNIFLGTAADKTLQKMSICGILFSAPVSLLMHTPYASNQIK